MARTRCFCCCLTNRAINQNAIQFVDNQRMFITHHTFLLTELAIISSLVSSQSKRASCSKYHGTLQSTTVFHPALEQLPTFLVMLERRAYPKPNWPAATKTTRDHTASPPTPATPYAQDDADPAAPQA